MEVPEGFANVRFVFSCSGVPDEMSFAVGVSPPTADSPEEIALKAHQAYSSEVPETGGGMYTGWSYLGTRVVKTVGGAPVLGDYNTSLVGTASAQSSIVSSALLIRKTSSLGGRKGRGRFYHPPCILAEAVVSNAGYIETTDYVILSAKFHSFYDALVTADLIPTLFHSDPADGPTTITDFVLQGQLATQRRRMR